MTPVEKRQQAKDMAEAIQKMADALGASPGTGHAIAAEFLKAAEYEMDKCKHDATEVDEFGISDWCPRCNVPLYGPECVCDPRKEQP